MEIEVIKVPAPKEVGKVNCILLDCEKPVLIDPGPDTEEAFQAVKTGLKQRNLMLDDIEKVLVTHPHSDHFGNARRVKEVSNAEICMHEEAARIVEDFQSYKEKQIKFFSEYFQKMGMTEEDVKEGLDSGLPNTYQTDLEVDEKLQDGEKLELSESDLTCVKVEGHAKGSLCFELEAENFLFTGDFILPDITPNPMLMLPDKGEEPPSSLGLYLPSLKQFENSDMKGFGGHEEVIENIGVRVGEIFEHHEERKKAMFDQLENGVTPFELMIEFFGDLPANQYYLGMAEIIAHLKLLEDENKVEAQIIENQVVYNKF